MYVELLKPHARLFSFVNRDGEVELLAQLIGGAQIVWQATMSGAEALQLAQQIEEAGRVAADEPIKTETRTRALDAKINPAEPYGFCPKCGARGKTSERSPEWKSCKNGHEYSSSQGVPF